MPTCSALDTSYHLLLYIDTITKDTIAVTKLIRRIAGQQILYSLMTYWYKKTSPLSVKLKFLGGKGVVDGEVAVRDA